MTIHPYEREKAAICYLVMNTGGGDTDPRYRALVTSVLEAGLFKRAYVQYLILGLLAIAGLASSLYFVTVFTNPWAQLLNGVLFAGCSMQFAMLAHDLSHGEVFESSKANRLSALLVWSLVAGLSERYWFQKHSSHHENPNHDGHDPDVDIPFVFDTSQLEQHSSFYLHYLLPYQHLLFWITLPLVYFWITGSSLWHLFTKRSAGTALELGLIVLHYAFIFIFVFLWAAPVAALAFLVGFFIAGGAYMGIAFAPNHKSEQVIDADAQYSWVYQITSTRNIFPTPLTSFLLGGLNFQIEHHLFPTMSRYRYFEAQKIVKVFCLRENIEYSETTWLQTMFDIHAQLKAQSCSLVSVSQTTA